MDRREAIKNIGLGLGSVFLCGGCEGDGGLVYVGDEYRGVPLFSFESHRHNDPKDLYEEIRGYLPRGHRVFGFQEKWMALEEGDGGRCGVAIWHPKYRVLDMQEILFGGKSSMIIH